MSILIGFLGYQENNFIHGCYHAYLNQKKKPKKEDNFKYLSISQNVQ